MEAITFVAVVSAVCEFWHQIREPLLGLISSL